MSIVGSPLSRISSIRYSHWECAQNDCRSAQRGIQMHKISTIHAGTLVGALLLLSSFEGRAEQAVPELDGVRRPVSDGLVIAQASTVGPARTGSERSIIIVSGKNSKSGSIGQPGSKVMLNPQPLPPRTTVNNSINSNGSKVMINPQPLPPKVGTGSIR
jgi:hypothetical protein